MAIPNIKSFNQLGEIIIQKYERYLPTAFDDSLTILEKVNKVIEYLNQMGLLANDVVTQWNDVMSWVLNDGLGEEVNAKLDQMTLDGTLAQIINVDMIGSLSNLQTTDKSNLVNAINEVKNKSNIVLSEDEPLSQDSNTYWLEKISENNVQMNYYNGFNWDNLFPVTLDTNIIDKDGVNIPTNRQITATVNNISELKSINRVNGVVMLLGYYTKGDNVPLLYSIESTGVEDYGTTFAMSNGRFAKALLSKGVTPNTFGINDTATNLNERWTNYLDVVNKTKGLYFKLLGQRYKVTKPLNIYKDMIGVNGETVLFVTEKFGAISPTGKTVNGVSLNYNACVYVTFNPNHPEWDDFSVTFKNIKIECNDVCDIGVLATDITRLTMNSITILDPIKIGLWCSRAWLSTFERITIYSSNLTQYGVVVGAIFGEFTANTNLNFVNVYVVNGYNGFNSVCRPFTFLSSIATNITTCASDGCNGDSFLVSNNSEIVINGVSSEAVTYTQSIFNLRNTTLKLNAMNMLMVNSPKLFYLKGTNKVMADVMMSIDKTEIIYFDSTADTNYLEIMPSVGMNRSLSIDPTSTFNNSLVLWKYPGLYGYARNSRDYVDAIV